MDTAYYLEQLEPIDHRTETITSDQANAIVEMREFLQEVLSREEQGYQLVFADQDQESHHVDVVPVESL